MPKVITCRPVLFIERHDRLAYYALESLMNGSMISGTSRAGPDSGVANY